MTLTAHPPPCSSPSTQLQLSHCPLGILLPTIVNYQSLHYVQAMLALATLQQVMQLDSSDIGTTSGLANAQARYTVSMASALPADVEVCPTLQVASITSLH